MEPPEDRFRISDLDKAHACHVKSRAYSIWLSAQTPENIVLVVGGALLSLVAGSSILRDQDVISPDTAGILALTSAAFGIIHSKLNCDAHQGECRRLRSALEGLSVDFTDVVSLDESREQSVALKELCAKYSSLVSEAAAEPAEWALRRAKAESKASCKPSPSQ